MAEFALDIKPIVRPLADKDTEEIKAIMTRRHQVREMITAERNRLYLSNTAVKPSIEEHIEWMKNQLKDIDKNLEDQIKKSPIWKEKDALLRSVPGVGKITSITLMGSLPELGKTKPQRDRCVSGRSASQQRQWHNARKAYHFRWPC